MQTYYIFVALLKHAITSSFISDLTYTASSRQRMRGPHRSPVSQESKEHLCLNIEQNYKMFDKHTISEKILAPSWNHHMCAFGQDCKNISFL